jgi:trans-aconitate methyltransferase
MSDGYIHGFSEREQKRLVDQARTMADAVFGEFDFSSGERLLEIGCGVGAQLKMLHERWPHLQLSGVDRNPHMLAGAGYVIN